MKKVSRRTFLQTTMIAGAGLALPTARVLGANDDIRLGFIGTGGRGSHSIGWFRKVPGVRVVALCDADRAHVDREKAKCEQQGEQVKTFTDARKLLAQDDVDAVVISTCNHTHALLTIWACEAGKDVYVEKPVCHTIWEGRQMAEAARKYKRIVQGGFQNRSDVGLREFYPYLHEGNLGKVKMVRGLCYRNRSGIGARRETPLAPPESVDYDQWLGPAPDLPIHRPRFHYDWHWIWNTGNGDVGNQGPHEMDLVRWALNDPELPTGVKSFGGRFGWDDAGETPNLQFVAFEHGDIPVMFEVCDMKLKPDLNASPNFRGTRVGVIVTCEGGEFRGGRGGGTIFDPEGQRVKRLAGDGGGQHAQNFIDTLRSRKISDSRCPVDSAWKSSSLSHLANISYRLGRDATPEQLADNVEGQEQMAEFLERYRPLLKDWNVDFAKTPFQAGPALTFDPQALRFTGRAARRANAMVHREDREGFAIPKLA